MPKERWPLIFYCGNWRDIRKLTYWKIYCRALGGLEGAQERIVGRPIAEGDSGRSDNEANSRARKETDPAEGRGTPSFYHLIRKL